MESECIVASAKLNYRILAISVPMSKLCFEIGDLYQLKSVDISEYAASGNRISVSFPFKIKSIGIKHKLNVANSNDSQNTKGWDCWWLNLILLRRGIPADTQQGVKMFWRLFINYKAIPNLFHRPWLFCYLYSVSSSVRELAVCFTTFIGLFSTILMILEKYMLRELT